MELNRTEIVNRTERPNSFEFGKAGRRHKVYYGTKEELISGIDSALEAEEHLRSKLMGAEILVGGGE